MSNPWRNPALFAAVRTYCLEVFGLWRNTYPTEEAIPRRAVQRAFIEGNTIRYPQEIRLDPIRLTFDRRIEDPGQIASRATVENVMRADERINRHLDTLVGTTGGSSRVTVDGCLGWVLRQLVEEQNTLAYNDDQFQQIYAAMENFFYSDTIPLRFMAPLELFEMQATRINLGNRFSVIEQSTAEREQTLLSSLQFPGFGMLPGQMRFGLELLIDAPKVFGEQPPQRDASAIPQTRASQELQEALSALRLFKTGHVSYSMMRQTTAGWAPFGGSYGFGLSRSVFGAPYALSAEEVARFETFWQKYRQARSRNRSRIDLALRRLNFGYDRIRPEDKLIDYVIGLEALLTKGNEVGDLKYRLTLRGARLLGNDATIRAKVHTELDWAYRLRSHIVHGTEVGPSVTIEQETVPFDELVERIAQHLRDAIRQFMMRTTSKSEADVIKELDREAIAGS